MKIIQLQIPDDLALRMQKITSNAESYILDLLKSKVNETDKSTVLANEYRLASQENATLIKDFAHTDMEGWDGEY
jgi:hypothetical protein